jgi:hypothetical protein
MSVPSIFQGESMKKVLTITLLVFVALSAFAASHPNLVEAQKLLTKAIEKIEAAQGANEFDLGGYAEKALKAIRQAKEQIKLASKAADGGDPGKVTASAFTTTPEMDVYAKKHPNLAEAQKLVYYAYERITAAQKANEYDMEGHAQKAKELLDKANELIKQAATYANEKKK